MVTTALQHPLPPMAAAGWLPGEPTHEDWKCQWMETLLGWLATFVFEKQKEVYF